MVTEPPRTDTSALYGCSVFPAACEALGDQPQMRNGLFVEFADLRRRRHGVHLLRDFRLYNEWMILGEQFGAFVRRQRFRK
jgi:hypothetical protein